VAAAARYLRRHSTAQQVSAPALGRADRAAPVRGASSAAGRGRLLRAPQPARAAPCAAAPARALLPGAAVDDWPAVGQLSPLVGAAGAAPEVDQRGVHLAHQQLHQRAEHAVLRGRAGAQVAAGGESCAVCMCRGACGVQMPGACWGACAGGSSAGRPPGAVALASCRARQQGRPQQQQGHLQAAAPTCMARSSGPISAWGRVSTASRSPSVGTCKGRRRAKGQAASPRPHLEVQPKQQECLKGCPERPERPQQQQMQWRSRPRPPAAGPAGR
jgi:hypothetical protein